MTKVFKRPVRYRFGRDPSLRSIMHTYALCVSKVNPTDTNLHQKSTYIFHAHFQLQLPTHPPDHGCNRGLMVNLILNLTGRTTTMTKKMTTLHGWTMTTTRTTSTTMRTMMNTIKMMIELTSKRLDRNFILKTQDSSSPN